MHAADAFPSGVDAGIDLRLIFAHLIYMDVVPAEVLDDTVDRRTVDRDLCALQLDGYLRRLARQEAVCRRVLGRLARTFLAGRSHHRLGFARLSDYTRERLSLSAREVQELARVTERLETLPAIAAAFAAGDLSWTQTRLLATAATADSEHEWLALARDRTVRALEALVAHPPADPDERRRLRFSLRCPRRVRGRWRQAIELARRMAGSELSLAQAAEVIAAEALSAAPAPIDDRPPREAPPEPIDTPADAGWSPVDVPVPEDVEKLLELGPWGDPFTLDERLRAARRAMQRIDWQMGVLLRTFFDLRLHRAFGFPSASRYVAGRLGLSARKARALVALERGLRRTPALAAAYREGAVSWLRALTVLPVATADDAWVARAGEVTLRRLVAEVEWALDRRDAGLPPAPPSPDATLAPVEWQMRAQHDETLAADITFTAPRRSWRCSAAPSTPSVHRARRSGRAARRSLSTCVASGRPSRRTATRSSHATAGAAPSRRAPRVPRCTTITSSIARRAATTRARTA